MVSGAHGAAVDADGWSEVPSALQVPLRIHRQVCVFTVSVGRTLINHFLAMNSKLKKRLVVVGNRDY